MERIDAVEIVNEIEKLAKDPAHQKRLREAEERERLAKMNDNRIEALAHLKTVGINYNKWAKLKFETEYEYQQKMLKAAREFTKDIQKGLIITGQTGAGKTHIMSQVLIGLINRGIKGRYFKWLEHGAYLKSIKNSPEFIYELNKYKKAPLLYIDDFLKVGKNSAPTDADIGLAFSILDYRKENDLPTMISCERSIEELLAIDEAVGGRVMELCKLRVELAAYKNVKNYRK